MSSMILPDLRRLQFSDSDRSCVPLPDIWGAPLTAKSPNPAAGGPSSVLTRPWHGPLEKQQLQADSPLEPSSSFKFSRYGLYSTSNTPIDKPIAFRPHGPFSSSHLTSHPVSPVRPITGLHNSVNTFNVTNNPSPICDFSPLPSVYPRSTSAGSSPTSLNTCANQRPANIWTSSYRAPASGNSSFSTYNYPVYHRSPFLNARPPASSPAPFAHVLPAEQQPGIGSSYNPIYPATDAPLQPRALFDSPRHTCLGNGPGSKRNAESLVHNRSRVYPVSHVKDPNSDSTTVSPEASSPNSSTSSPSASVPALDAGSASSSSSSSSPSSSASNASTAMWNTGSGRTRNNYKRSGAGFKLTLNTDLYKTELCVPFMKSGGHCPYDDKCQFAHGEAELKQVDRPAKWRSKPCQNWVKLGSCSYNERCCFRHDV